MAQGTRVGGYIKYGKDEREFKKFLKWAGCNNNHQGVMEAIRIAIKCMRGEW